MLPLLGLLLLLPPQVLSTCPPEYSADSNSFSLQQYAADRTLCTQSCNTGGFCCTLGSGGCNVVPCTTGCHIAWFSASLAACKAQCDVANAAPDCSYTYRHAEISGAGYNPSWVHGEGVPKCTGSDNCGCPADADPSWGTSNDCSSSACAAGCDFAYDAVIRDNFFHGEDVTVDAQLGLDDQELIVSLDLLTGHFDATAPLSPADLQAATTLFSSHAAIMETLLDTMTKALDLIDLMESHSEGPLFLTDATKNGITRDEEPTSLQDTEHRSMLVVHQAVLDNIFSGMLPEDGATERVNKAPVSACTDFLNGRKWKTASFFPGHVDPPTDPTVTHTVAIAATMPKYWGKPVCFCTERVTRPTGLYLAPGGIATVTVPQSVVDNGGFTVQVGAARADNVDKDNMRRMDRVTTTYDVDSTTVHVANPLGGGVYINVPYLADLGTVSVTVSGGVVQAPIFSKTSVKTTTKEEWDAVKDAPGVWADFETDKFLLQVPRVWMYDLSYEHVRDLMRDYDKAMDGMNEMGGFPEDKRNNHVLYLQPDLQIREIAYGVGYPQINQEVSADENGPRANGPPGASTHWMVQDPVEWSVTYHEAGHCQLQSFYRGESEASNNLYHAYINNVKFGMDLDTAFSLTLGHAVMTPDQAAINWMITENFGNGAEMDRSNTPADEFRYQQRGYAKYIDIARLYGWDKISGFYNTENVVSETGVGGNEGDGLGIVDDRTLRLSIAAGFDLTPLIDFWGIHPVNAAALAAKVAGLGLAPSKHLSDLLQRYVTIVPMSKAAFDVHFDEVWPGMRGVDDGHDERYGHGWYNKWSDVWDEALGAKGRDAAQAVVDKWFGDVEWLADVDCVESTADRSTCTEVGQELYTLTTPAAGSGQLCTGSSTLCVAGDVASDVDGEGGEGGDGRDGEEVGLVPMIGAVGGAISLLLVGAGYRSCRKGKSEGVKRGGGNIELGFH